VRSFVKLVVVMPAVLLLSVLGTGSASATANGVIASGEPMPGTSAIVVSPQCVYELDEVCALGW